jgi:ATP phosphoribosyltransferase
MSVIGTEDHDPLLERYGRPLRVATKFPNITRAYFAKQGVPVELIRLHGNIELAPMMGLTDCVVDLVATGETLRRNGLKAYHRFLDVSARLVCNRASYRLRFTELQPLFKRLTDVVARRC